MPQETHSDSTFTLVKDSQPCSNPAQPSKKSPRTPSTASQSTKCRPMSTQCKRLTWSKSKNGRKLLTCSLVPKWSTKRSPPSKILSRQWYTRRRLASSILLSDCAASSSRCRADRRRRTIYRRNSRRRSRRHSRRPSKSRSRIFRRSTLMAKIFHLSQRGSEWFLRKLRIIRRWFKVWRKKVILLRISFLLSTFSTMPK